MTAPMPVPSRLSIPRRVFLGFALVLTVSSLVSVASFVQHQRSAATLRLLHDGYLPLSLSLSEVRAAQSVFDNLLSRLAKDGKSSATRAWLSVGRRARPERLARALKSIALIQGSAPPASERATLAKIRRELRKVRTALRQNEARYEALYSAIEAGRRREVDRLIGELRARERSIDGRLRLVWTTVLGRIKATSERAESQQQASVVVLAVLGLIALLVGVAVTWWSQRVLSPLPKLQERVEAVARGEFVRQLRPGRSDDEIGRLAQEFERMVAALAARERSLHELQHTQAQILSDLSAAVVVVDGDGHVRVANPAAVSLLGIGGEGGAQTLSETGLLERLPELDAAMREVAEGGRPQELIEVTLAGPRALRLDVLVRPFSPEPDAGAALLIVAEDVTDAVATKGRLIQSERLAAIGRMAAHITHEVRNPLSSIGLNVEMLEEELGEGPGEARALLTEIHREIERLRGVTEEYLRVARLPSPVLEPEDLGDLVRGTVAFVRRELTGDGVRIELTADTELPLVAVDEAQLRQVMLNLLRNAREALPEAGGTIEVTLSRVTDGAGGVSLRVSDDGAGMDEETRRRVFDLFYTTKKLGTGLGLPLTQQIVLAHGGTIICDSTEGEGTSFTLWFPAAAKRAGEASGPDDSPRRSETSLRNEPGVHDDVPQDGVVS